jgi:ubiquinone biosynthesis monooxygenase Coq7
MRLPTFDIDRAIVQFDRVLRTLFSPPVAARAAPDEDLPEAELTDQERRHSAALMRVNHTGEICAQALYHGQALTARSEPVRRLMEQAAREEGDHLAWTAARVEQLQGHTSVLNPLFYAGAFALGVAAGTLGDRWNLGLLAETERQVEGHLDGHLELLPLADAKSRALVRQMKQEETAHAQMARLHGARELPQALKRAMRAAARLMTGSTYWI